MGNGFSWFALHRATSWLAHHAILWLRYLTIFNKISDRMRAFLSRDLAPGGRFFQTRHWGIVYFRALCPPPDFSIH